VTRLKNELTPLERKQTVNRLWLIAEAIDRGESAWRLREMVTYTAFEIEPYGAQYEEPATEKAA
jgi:hypothetical protein